MVFIHNIFDQDLIVGSGISKAEGDPLRSNFSFVQSFGKLDQRKRLAPPIFALASHSEWGLGNPGSVTGSLETVLILLTQNPCVFIETLFFPINY